MATADVMRRHLEATRGGDRETAFGFFAPGIESRIPGRSALAGGSRGRDVAWNHVERARALSRGAEVELLAGVA